MGPRARELLSNLAVGILWCSVFGATAGIAVTVPAGGSFWQGVVRGILTGLIAGTTIGGFELLDRGTLMARPTLAGLGHHHPTRRAVFRLSRRACSSAGSTQWCFGQPLSYLTIDADWAPW